MDGTEVPLNFFGRHFLDEEPRMDRAHARIPHPMLKDSFKGRAENAPDEVRDPFRHGIIPYRTILLGPLIQNTDKLGWEPTPVEV